MNLIEIVGIIILLAFCVLMMIGLFIVGLMTYDSIKERFARRDRR